MLKQHKKVCRVGWNGKKMFLVLINGDDYCIYDSSLSFESIRNVSEFLPWIAMKTADNKLVPWLTSQSDLLAEDWIVID